MLISEFKHVYIRGQIDTRVLMINKLIGGGGCFYRGVLEMIFETIM